MCTSDFLVQVLKGEKKALLQHEVNSVNVPINKYTSKEQLGKMIVNDAFLKRFFPDDPPT